jgi:hypothetical protein
LIIWLDVRQAVTYNVCHVTHFLLQQQHQARGQQVTYLILRLSLPYLFKSKSNSAASAAAAWLLLFAVPTRSLSHTPAHNKTPFSASLQINWLG